MSATSETLFSWEKLPVFWERSRSIKENLSQEKIVWRSVKTFYLHIETSKVLGPSEIYVCCNAVSRMYYRSRTLVDRCYVLICFIFMRSGCMATIFKIFCSMIVDCECSRYICTGWGTVWLQCLIVLKSLLSYCILLSAGTYTRDVQWSIKSQNYVLDPPSDSKGWRPPYTCIPCVLHLLYDGSYCG